LRRKVDELLKEHCANDSLLARPAGKGERTAAVESLAEEAPAKMLGRYKLLEKIGEGVLRQIIREREPLRPSTKLNTLPGDARTTAGKRRQTDVGKLVHQLQGDLDWIVMKCLEKDRTRRYDTATGLAMDIQRHLSNEPVAARPP